MSDITFVISAYDRPHMLRACLASLAFQGGEMIVADNSTYPAMIHGIKNACLQFGAIHCHTGTLDALRYSCYDSTEFVARDATTEWLCFPSEDSLYVADFSKIMLETAARNQSDLVYCDCVYKEGVHSAVNWPPYAPMECFPRMGSFDKTQFILRRSCFEGFPKHYKDYRDGALAKSLMERGIRHSKAPGLLVVHQ